jgi:hypothetical protein
MKKEERKKVEAEVHSAIAQIFAKINHTVSGKFEKNISGPVKSLVKKFAKHIKAENKQKARIKKSVKKKPVKRAKAVRTKAGARPKK